MSTNTPFPQLFLQEAMSGLSKRSSSAPPSSVLPRRSMRSTRRAMSRCAAAVACASRLEPEPHASVRAEGEA